MDDDQQFCLRWNNHQSTLVSVFDTLLEKGMHVDCTLAAEGQTLKAHKVVLSACSPYFECVLSQNYDKHPIIILKDVKYAELRAMMDYMYRGEVNISQDQLAALLKAAESLQIKGLSDNKPSRPPSRPPPAAQPHAAHTAHPPRPDSPTPPHQAIEGSIDSREGSVSPTRRRKKARRTSLEALPLALPMPLKMPPTEQVQGNGDDPPCKEEREGVEDLTIDEDAEEQPPGVHNDVVRSFQWHMERSQDELMNSSDSIRDSQDEKSLQHNIVTRSKKSVEEPPIATTFAVLKTVKSSQLIDPKAPKLLKQDAKENKTVLNMSPPAPPPPPLTPKPRGRAGGVKKEPYERRDRHAGDGERAKEYKCPNCRRSYNARRNLLRHISLECGREPQYKCPYCSFCRHRRNELKNHLQKKHPNLYTNADMKALVNKKDLKDTQLK